MERATLAAAPNLSLAYQLRSQCAGHVHSLPVVMQCEAPSPVVVFFQRGASRQQFQQRRMLAIFIHESSPEID
ncbi:hypothetical protein B1806_07485 [Metallibacterium scheffleri]|uniref:Uncharacterized protein n=1 Tax=Metallibacterium scheffleri TaxID=993689 RepID=A0A4S3KP24_9GAMM|nr:hypothetical protein B1806_07485 [Metallibacterium scheffleri]